MENECLLTDLYQLTMAAAYYNNAREDIIATFDLSVRNLPDSRNYLIVAGIEQALDYITNLRFKRKHIKFLRSLDLFDNHFLKYLRKVRFTGDVRAMAEGSIAFQQEPIMEVTAPIIEAQLIESRLINIMQFQTMIASKASRIVTAAKGRILSDFSLRRTHAGEAAIMAARAAYIGGFNSTSNVLAGKMFGIPVAGTMAHSFVTSYEDETTALFEYLRTFPDNLVFLVDTYDTHKAVSQICTHKEIFDDFNIKGIRIDSGNFLAQSIDARKMLNKAGLKDTRIIVSGNMDEYTISELISNGAKIDIFGVGTHLGVSKDAPTLNMVYKLSEVVVDGKSIPKMKFSENKMTLPGRKQVYRKYNSRDNISGDLIALACEDKCELNQIPLLEPIMLNGKLISPDSGSETKDARNRVYFNMDYLPNKLKRLDKQEYPVKTSKEMNILIDRLRGQLND